MDCGQEVCPACGGSLQPQRMKLICEQCQRIVESCCEGQLLSEQKDLGESQHECQGLGQVSSDVERIADV